MSAGGLSYDLLTTSRKATLPSVEMWNTNMNILRDPNSGIYTRRVDKVGDTQGILLAQDNSGDRIAECINVYARGVNPMVSVSYDNNSNNAGLRGSLINRNQGVKLPYRPEVYRPPVFRQEDLMPLSRQPRNWFYAIANPELPNVIQNMQCNETKSSTIEKLLNVEGPPSYQKNIELPQYPSTPKHHTHEDKSHYEVVSNIKGLKQSDEFRDILRYIQKKAINDDLIKTSAFSTKSKVDQNFAITPKVIEKIREEILRMKDVKAMSSFQEKDTRYDRSTSNNINNNKLSYEILTQKIKKLEQSFFNGTPVGTVKEVLLYETNTKPSFVEKYSDDFGALNPSFSIKEDSIHTEAFTKPTSSYQLNAENKFSETPFIIPGNRLGSWAVGNTNKSFQGSSMESPENVLQASKTVMTTNAHSNPTSSRFHETTPIDTAHSIKNITPLDVTSVKAIPTQESWNHPEKMDRPMKERRNMSTEVNHKYNTKTMLHDTMSSGKVENKRTPIQATSQKTFYDKNIDFGEKNIDRRKLLVEDFSTERDIRADGTNLYNVQSRNGQTYINNRPAAGSFHSIGNSIPKMDMLSAPSEMPIDSQWTNVKREAYRQQQSRFTM